MWTVAAANAGMMLGQAVRLYIAVLFILHGYKEPPESFLILYNQCRVNLMMYMYIRLRY